MRPFRSALFLVLTLVLLAGCYMPDRFEAGMQLRKDGKYAFTYQGELTSLQLLRRLGQGEFDGEPDAFREALGSYERDLRRDSGFKEVSYWRQATFKTRYTHEGNLNRDRSFNFVRLNSRFLGVNNMGDGRIEIGGNRLPQAYMDALLNGGYDSRGVFRVWTDARVVDHNADKVEGQGLVLYTWRIRTMRQAPPRMVLQIDPSAAS